jgi:hypothetical protein
MHHEMNVKVNSGSGKRLTRQPPHTARHRNRLRAMPIEHERSTIFLDKAGVTVNFRRSMEREHAHERTVTNRPFDSAVLPACRDGVPATFGVSRCGSVRI